MCPAKAIDDAEWRATMRLRHAIWLSVSNLSVGSHVRRHKSHQGAETFSPIDDSPCAVLDEKADAANPVQRIRTASSANQQRRRESAKMSNVSSRDSSEARSIQREWLKIKRSLSPTEASSVGLYCSRLIAVSQQHQLIRLNRILDGDGPTGLSVASQCCCAFD